MPLTLVHRSIKMHRAQQAFRKSNALYRGFVGGRGAGKSWVGAYDLIRRVQPGCTYLVVSPTYVLMEDTTLPTFTAIARDLGVYRSIKATPRPNVRLAKGVTIRFRSAEDPDKLRGPNLSGVWLDEASLMEEEAYQIAIACLREGGQQGWLSATFTPKGLTHWTYNVFGQQPPRPNTEVIHAKTRDNPFNPIGFHDTIAQQYSGLRAAQELDGRFVAIEGAEWPAEFFPDSIWFDEWPDNLAWRAMALDPSKGQHDKTKKGKLPDDSAIVSLGVTPDAVLWVDADMDNARPVEAGPGEPSIVDSAIQRYQEFRPAGVLVECNGFQELVATALRRVARERRIEIMVYAITSSVSKESRIRNLTVYLAQRRLRVRNTKGGRRLVQQMRDFPMGEHDDGPDALHMATKLVDYLISGKSGNTGVAVLRT